MTVKPTVSIVMPAHNASRSIAESIESVKAQTYKQWELIVVDDCSDDDTAAIVQNTLEADRRIHLKRLDENVGVAKARNVGIEAASGQWIALLDSDDLWVENKLSRQLIIASKTSAQIIYSSYDYINANGEPCGMPFQVPGTIGWEEMLRCNYIGCSTAMVDARLLKSNPFSADFYHEDYLLWMQLIRSGALAVGCKSVLMHYRISKNSRSYNKINSARQRWAVYRDGLGLSLIASMKAFSYYAASGLLKHRSSHA